MHDQAVDALYAVIKAAVGGIATVERHGVEDGAIPPGGLVTIRDGEAGEPEVYLGLPRQYGYEREAEVVVQVQHAKPSARDAALSGLLASIEAAVEADASLGGVVEYCDLSPPDVRVEHVQGGNAIKVALITAVISYTTDKRLT